MELEVSYFVVPVSSHTGVLTCSHSKLCVSFLC